MYDVICALLWGCEVGKQKHHLVGVGMLKNERTDLQKDGEVLNYHYLYIEEDIRKNFQGEAAKF
jgi:hypothetical protein